ncbi:MAG: FeoB-associated Cys-rich membrane protein [Bacillota bacterium]
MINIIVSLVILVIVSGAITKIILDKKNGAKCIGCPYSESDDDNCNCPYTGNEN